MAARRCEDTVTSSRVILLGSGGFAVPSFRAIAADRRFDVVAVVTAPPRAAGRSGALQPTPVDAWATGAGLRVERLAAARAPAAMTLLKSIDARLGLLADFGQIIPAELLQHFPGGIVNLHPSLLPRHRGASPIPAAILAGDRETGVSTISMDRGVDSGPIIAVQKVPLRAGVTATELESELAALAAVRIGETLDAWVRGEAAARPQTSEGATVTRRLTRGDGRIGAGTDCTLALRMWRAYQPWPGLWVELVGVGERLILNVVSDAASSTPPAPGLLATVDGALHLGLPGGAIRLDRVTPAGGRTMSGEEYARGREGGPASRGRIAE